LIEDDDGDENEILKKIFVYSSRVAFLHSLAKRSRPILLYSVSYTYVIHNWYRGVRDYGSTSLDWPGHVLRMSNNRLPRPFSAVNWRKAHVLAVDSESIIRTCWRPTWSAATLHLSSSRSDWRSHCKTWVKQFEAGRVRTLETKREQRKTGTYLNAASFPCDVSGCSYASRSG